MQKISIPTAQLGGMVAAIVGVVLYTARIETKAKEAHTRVLELKHDIEQINRDIRKHGEVLAMLKSDGQHIIKALERLQSRRRRQ